MRKLRPALAAATVAAATATTLALPATASATPNRTTAVTVQASTQGESSAAAACTRWKTLRISKGALTYKACKSRGYIKVIGKLRDTRRDGRAVYGKVRFRPSGHTHHYRATDWRRAASINTGWHRARSVVLSIR